MLTICWAAKGGSGTTVVTATLALSRRTPTQLVDLAGDLPIALGLPVPDGPGIGEWSRSSASPGRLDALRVTLADGLDLLPGGHQAPAGRWHELGGHLAGLTDTVIVDADALTVTLLWRTQVPLQTGPHDVRAITVICANAPPGPRVNTCRVRWGRTTGAAPKR